MNLQFVTLALAFATTTGLLPLQFLFSNSIQSKMVILNFYYIDPVQLSSFLAFPLNDEVSQEAFSLKRENQATDKKNVGKDSK